MSDQTSNMSPKDCTTEQNEAQEGSAAGEFQCADLFRQEIFAQKTQPEKSSAAQAEKHDASTQENSDKEKQPAEKAADKDKTAETTVIKPEALLDPAALKNLLIQADKAHRDFEQKNDIETPWSEFYANYLNQRIKAGGHEGIDEKALAKVFEEAGAAHHDFETKLGKPDEDWPGWYANFVSEKLKSASAN